MAKEKIFKVEVTRYYCVTDEFEVTAKDKDQAKEIACEKSDNTDYSGGLDLDHVTAEIIG